MPLFFLSHERSSEQYVRQFFDDLCREVLEHTGDKISGAPVGFVDHDANPPAGEWPPSRLEALQSCQAFVALCSPRYFRTAHCGKEWGLFQARLVARARPVETPALLPLFWVRTDVPETVSSLNFEDPRFGEEYRRRGLRDLIRMERLRDDYIEVVSIIASSVAATARIAPPPPLAQPPSLRASPDAFIRPVVIERRAPVFPYIRIDDAPEGD